MPQGRQPGVSVVAQILRKRVDHSTVTTFLKVCDVFPLRRNPVPRSCRFVPTLSLSRVVPLPLLSFDPALCRHKSGLPVSRYAMPPPIGDDTEAGPFCWPEGTELLLRLCMPIPR